MVAAGRFPFPLQYISHRQRLSFLAREIKKPAHVLRLDTSCVMEWRFQNKVWLRKIERKTNYRRLWRLYASALVLIPYSVSLSFLEKLHPSTFKSSSMWHPAVWQMAGLCFVLYTSTRNYFRNIKPDTAIDSAQFCNWIVLRF